MVSKGHPALIKSEIYSATHYLILKINNYEKIMCPTTWGII
jgi:hypothetical protein